MTFTVQLYQVLIILVPMMGAGIKFYTDITKRQALQEAEIARLREDFEEIYARLGRVEQSTTEIQSSTREIKELMNFLNRK